MQKDLGTSEAVEEERVKESTPVYKRIKTGLPTNGTVSMLVLLVNILDHLQQPVLRHFASSEKIAKALTDAGRLKSTFHLIVSLIAL